MNKQFPIDCWGQSYVGHLQNEICQIKELMQDILKKTTPELKYNIAAH